MRVRGLDELLVLQHPKILSLRLCMSKHTVPYSLLRDHVVQGLTLSCFQIRLTTPLPHSLHFSHTDLAVSSKCSAYTCLRGFLHLECSSPRDPHSTLPQFPQALGFAQMASQKVILPFSTPSPLPCLFSTSLSPVNIILHVFIYNTFYI